jgi:hypothetical protein
MVAFKFENENWGQPPHPPNPIGDLRFRQLFTDADWRELPVAVRQRFGRRVAIGDALIYRGHVEYNRVNRWGHLLNKALKIVGAPLPLDTQNAGAAAIVTVTESPSGGQIWMRQYARQDDRRPFPQVIQSAKQFIGDTGIEEHIGRGIGMSLMPLVEGEELVFRAKDIFWDIGLGGTRKIRFTLPKWLGPNVLRAGHEELGNNAFVFTLRLEHKWFGTLLDQRVWFQDDLR